jgi:hypothetical protein
MGTLKESIKHEVHLLEAKSLEHAFSVERKVKSKNMGTRRVATNNHKEHHVPSPILIECTMLKP